MKAIVLKKKTEAFLKKENIPINEFLPKIEELSEFAFASPKQIRERAVALSHVLARAYGAPYDLVKDSIKNYDLEKIFSPKELELIHEQNPASEVCQPFQSEVESLWELAWVIGLIPNVNHWSVCGNNLINLIPKPGQDPREFIDTDRSRSRESIYEESDLLFRLHWASREAFLAGREGPTGVPEYAIDKRHKAINWVTFSNESWDRVDTST